MRINKLKLTRFGSFTNKTIDFGERDPQLDLHILFGPNEAGKSTLRSAVESFLYGIPLRTGYDFLHEAKTLQIEADISSGDTSLELKRIKRNSNSLLGKDQQSVGDDLLWPLLNGVDRDAYVNMFSMDEDSLETGGDSILKSEGDLGELLFSSTSGLAALGSELGGIRLKNEEFYKSRGQKVRLKQKTAELKALKDQIKALDVPASRYAALKKTEREAHAAHTSASDERKQLDVERLRLKSLLDCIGPWRSYLDLQSTLAAMPEFPEVPQGLRARAEKLAQQAVGFETMITQLNQRLAKARQGIEGIELDTQVLLCAADIDRLTEDDTEAKFRASDDLQEANSYLHTLDEQVAVLVTRLDVPADTAVNQLLLPAARTGLIRSLIEQRVALDASFLAAKTELGRATTQLEQAKAVAQSATAIEDLSELAHSLAVAREQGIDSELARRRSEYHKLKLELDQSMIDLEPWRGDLARLKALSIPAKSELDTLLQTMQDLTNRSGHIDQEQQRLAGERARLGSERKLLLSRSDLTSDQAAAEVRQARQKAWLEHRAGLNMNPLDAAELQTSADRFESALAQDDALGSARLAQSQDIVELRSLERALARVEADHEQIVAVASQVAAAKAQADQLASRLCSELGLPVKSLEDIPTWLERRAHAMRLAEQTNAVSQECDSLEQSLLSCVKQLNAGLKSAGVVVSDNDFSRSLQLAGEAVVDWQERRALEKSQGEALQNKEREVDERKARLDEVESLVIDWDKKWANALDGLWLARGERLPAVAEMNQILQALGELEALQTKATDARTAVNRLVARRDAYISAVSDLSTRLGELDEEGAEKADVNPLQIADRLRKRLAAALEQQRTRQELSQEHAALEAQLEEQLALQDQARTEFREMSKVFPARDFSDLLQQLRGAEERMRLSTSLVQLEAQMSDLLGVLSFADARELLAERLADAQRIESLKVDHAAALSASEECNERVSQRYHEWRAAADALSGVGDGADVALLNEQVRVLLMDIEADTRRYIARTAGVLVVDRALQTYMATHRSSMLKRASSAFATITRGAFTGLDAMPGVLGKSREELVGIRSDGSSTSAKEMSRGSRFQLYLSLRIAGYHEFVSQRTPLPFFADDILETFDDDRSRETFGLMAEMARHGQVIYLTHHEHLCEIASEVTGGRARIHRLPQRSLMPQTRD